MSFREWEEVKLGEIVDIVDSLHRTPVYSKKGVPMIRVTDLHEGFLKINKPVFVTEEVYVEFSKKHKPKYGDIILSRVGTCGIVSLVKTNEKFCLGQNTLVITNFNNYIDGTYLYYSLISSFVKEQMEILATGSTQKTISLKSLKSLKINLPPVKQQKSIVNILSTLDEKIEVNHQINKTLETMAQAIFKQWFVDFEFPNEDGEPYQSSGGEMVESELGLVPKGWVVGTLNDLGEVIGGGTPSKKRDDYFTDNGIPWITPKDLSNNKNRYFTKGAMDITELGLKNSSAKKMPAGTVLFSSRAPIGYITIAKNEVTTNQGFKSIVPKKEIGSEFVYQTLKMNTEVIQNRASGSTFKEISGGELKKIQIVLPDVRLISGFIEIIDPISEMIMEREDEIEKLKNVRDMLLPKLIAGEIIVQVLN